MLVFWGVHVKFVVFFSLRSIVSSENWRVFLLLKHAHAGQTDLLLSGVDAHVIEHISKLLGCPTGA